LTIFINPYKRGSKSANALKDALRAKGIKTIIRYRAPIFASPMLVFWGNCQPEYPLDRYRRIINDPTVLPYMTNKLRFFRRVGHEPYVPEWTTDHQEASAWEGRVVCRHILDGHSGAGIEIWEASQNRPLPFAPLYVRYEKKTHEFRLHMARVGDDNFEPILVQRKIARKGEAKNFEVRNHANGFIYVTGGFETPRSVINLGKDFMKNAFPELHFCALDVIYHEPTQREFVLEGNTAPGLEGNTVNVYADYFQRLAA
jgi:hypothetical protein